MVDVAPQYNVVSWFDTVERMASLRESSIDRIEQVVDAGRPVVIGGSMGIGKTHLLGEIVGRLRAGGWVCTELRANAGAATIPFGALAGFAVGGEGDDRLAMLRATVDTLASIGAGRRRVVCIDDAPLLDDQSVAVLHRLVEDHHIPLLATARASDAESPALSALWASTDAHRVTLEPLDAAAATELVAERLDDPADTGTVDAIVRRAHGNPLFLGELVRAANDSVEGGLTPRLRDVVGARIARLDAATQQQLLFVAVADPLDTDLDIAEADELDRLERAGLVVSFEDGEFVLARPAHPLYGEIVRESLTALRRKEVARSLAHAMRRRSSVRRGDALRLAGWLRACGDEPSAELAVPAALEAISLLDADLANELVSIAIAVEPDHSALCAAGEIARLTGDYERALQWFEQAFARATTDDETRSVALAIGQIHGFYRGAPDDAVRVLGEAADRMVDPAKRLELETERAMFGAMLGRYEDVLVSAGRILDHPDCDAEARWTALTNVSWAEAQLMDLREVGAHLEGAKALISGVAAERAGEIDLVFAVEVNVAMEQGRLREVDDVGTIPPAPRPGQLHAAATSTRPSGLTAFSVSQVRWMLGDVAGARRLLDASLEQLAVFDAFNAYPFVAAASALLAVNEGDPERATADIDASTERGGGSGMWDRLWLGRARACLAVAEGRVDEAVAAIVAAAADGDETSHRGWATLALHDGLAWAATAEMADRARSLRASMYDAALMETLADSIVAAAEGDREALAAHRRTLQQMGSRWHAGVVSAAIARLADGHGESATARREATRALLWLPSGAPCPAELESVAITRRQLDVVRAALTGATSREIAQSLFVSVRTVDNHLGAVYGALDVNSRSELVDVLAF